MALSTRRFTTVARILTLAAAITLPGLANASHYDGQCAYKLNILELTIKNADFVGRRAATDQSNLLAKLEAANAKIAATKYDDAIDKLSNISDTATRLAGGDKPKLLDASDINEAVGKAINCVAELI